VVSSFFSLDSFSFWGTGFFGISGGGGIFMSEEIFFPLGDSELH
jgi:hypothetical protein